MLIVRDLRSYAQSVDDPTFRTRVGPFVLVQRPPEPVLQAVAMRLGKDRTVMMAHRRRLAEELVEMLCTFDDLLVANLPPLTGEDELKVGRLGDCQLMIHEPSVSKTHAVLRWNADSSRCSVQDLDSTNGTFLNASALGGEEVELNDGDTLSFGDAQFVFLLAPTLRQQLLAMAR